MVDVEPQRELVRVTLEGTYKPSNYFEEPVILERTGFVAKIDDGRIEVDFRDLGPLPTSIRQVEVSREVDLIFNARAILFENSAEVSALTMKCYYSDGTRDIYGSVIVMMCFGSMKPTDFVLTNDQGKVVKDTKAERIADENSFRDQCLRHANDVVANSLLKSFRHALTDPANMMTHLYEIRDALSRYLAGDRGAKKTLGLSSADWSRFGQITNKEPIQESRHRGDHAELRPVTEQERAQAHDFARRMLRSYLDHLDRESP